MAKKWLIPDKLISFDEKTRAELSPQIVELDCTDENLSNQVTHANYKAGAIDAYGHVIKPNKGWKMSCVDWRGKHAPHVWKVYQMKDKRFIKVSEFKNKDEALAHAESLAGGMQ